MSAEIKVIMKRPGELAKCVSMENTLKAFQLAVDGYIETVTIGDLVLVVNEEGMINGMPYNCMIEGHRIFGPVVVCGRSGGDLADIPFDAASIARLIQWWR